jgi:hypothetical protein
MINDGINISVYHPSTPRKRLAFLPVEVTLQGKTLGAHRSPKQQGPPRDGVRHLVTHKENGSKPCSPKKIAQIYGSSSPKK